MSLIQISNLSFSYTGALEPVFSGVSLELDSRWRLGLVGRNGRGKTTFLRLLLGTLKGSGNIMASEPFEYFPLALLGENHTAMEVARAVVAPFAKWEEAMNALAERGTEEAMQEFGEIENQYSAAGGYTINEMLVAELRKLEVREEVLARPFQSLSGGEQVKLQLAALFLKKHHFLLIDEPTDHLDAMGRKAVARWLGSKQGFIVVSHDRTFLDEAINHVLSINRTNIELQRGNYSSWRENRQRQDDFELAEYQKLEGSIARLKEAAGRTKRWSDAVEKTKTGGGQSTYNRGPASLDKGYVGHKAAKMMQRSKAIERRQTKEIEEKQTLLQNVEETETLRFHLLPAAKRCLLRAEGITLDFGQRMLFQNLHFSIEAGQRVALCGRNGSGKSCLLNVLRGQQTPTAGVVHRMGGLVVSSLPQSTDFLQGPLRTFAQSSGLDESLFLALLRKLDFGRELFSQNMQQYSAGQKKKVCLAASLATPAHLFLWDEPLNYIDVLSREQIEQAVLESAPAMLFAEHDSLFAQRVATGEIWLGQG